MGKIGLYGGTFNPIHNTHIAIAEAAQKQFQLDKMVFLLAGMPPHKTTCINVTGQNRYEMLQLAIKEHAGFEIDLRELARPGKSYSYITLQEYALEYPGDQIYFIMGSDSLLNFENWVKPEIISVNCTVIAAPRLGDDTSRIQAALDRYKQIFPGDFQIIDYQPNSLSSTAIRGMLSAGNLPKNNITESVMNYIKEHNLYRNIYDYDTVIKLQKKMEESLKNSRYIHTLGVANMAYSLAIRYDYPANNAMVAGMLHDCAKCISDEKRIDICQKNGIPITEIEYKFPHLLHGKVGAYWAEHKYNIADEQICHAIKVHTTGCPDMSLLDKIIFVADYIEPGRDKQPRLDIIRSTAFSNLDLCVYMILEDTVAYLNEAPDCVDQMTIDTYNYYKERHENNEF